MALHCCRRPNYGLPICPLIILNCGYWLNVVLGKVVAVCVRIDPSCKPNGKTAVCQALKVTISNQAARH